jgi:hypothetical protein
MIRCRVIRIDLNEDEDMLREQFAKILVVDHGKPME